jgi:hypothetical protein
MVSFTQGDDSHFVGLSVLFAYLPGNEMVAVTLPSYFELLLRWLRMRAPVTY